MERGPGHNTGLLYHAYEGLLVLDRKPCLSRLAVAAHRYSGNCPAVLELVGVELEGAGILVDDLPDILGKTPARRRLDLHCDRHRGVSAPSRLTIVSAMPPTSLIIRVERC